MYKLDKKAFRVSKVKGQENFVSHWMTKKPIERLEASWYLTCSAYGLDIHNVPVMDKTVFRRRKRP